MAKSSKRIAAGALAFMTALSLTACSTDNNSSGANNSSDNSSSTPSNSSDNNSTSSAGGDTSEPSTPSDGQSEWEADYSEFIPKETVTLEVYSQLSNYSGKQLGWFADIMKEKFNVELNIINNPDGTFADRKSVV